MCGTTQLEIIPNFNDFRIKSTTINVRKPNQQTHLLGSLKFDSYMNLYIGIGIHKVDDYEGNIILSMHRENNHMMTLLKMDINKNITIKYNCYYEGYDQYTACHVFKMIGHDLVPNNDSIRRKIGGYLYIY